MELWLHGTDLRESSGTALKDRVINDGILLTSWKSEHSNLIDSSGLTEM